MLSIDRLVAAYGRHRILDDLSFQIAAGEAVALWGPNGAGKTTLLRCVLGLLPFRGVVRIGGHDVRRDGIAARRLIGYVPQELALYDEMRVAEALHFFARLRRTAVAVDPALAAVGLDGSARRRVGQLSGGMKQRLALAIATMADPPLLLLDEPTSNLDTEARTDLVARLRLLHERGKTILLISHRPEEVSGLATRVLTLESGRLVGDAAWRPAPVEADSDPVPLGWLPPGAARRRPIPDLAAARSSASGFVPSATLPSPSQP